MKRKMKTYQVVLSNQKTYYVVAVNEADALSWLRDSQGIDVSGASVSLITRNIY